MTKKNTKTNELKALFNRHEQFVILTHLKPDGDTLGSSIALCRYLRAQGKQAMIHQSDPIPDNLSFLDTSCFSKEVVPASLLISIDASDEGRLDSRLGMYSLPIVNIDHHRTNTWFGDYHFIKQASSTAELVYELLNAFGWTPDLQSLEALYTAIVTDTNRFLYDSTTSSTLRAVAEMMELGLRVQPIHEVLYSETPMSKIRLQAYVLGQAQSFAQGRILVGELRADEHQRFDNTDTDDIVELLRDIKGVRVSVFFYEYKNDWKVSLRSKYPIDVSEVAFKYGGGGHTQAAGIHFSQTDYQKYKEALLQDLRMLV